MQEKNKVWPEQSLLIESLDLDAQGIAHREDGKVVFVDGALPFERVSVNINRKKNNWEKGSLTQIHLASSQRVTPKCKHAGYHAGACGGCKMQHLNSPSQIAVKQRVLEDNLWHLGKIKPDLILRPIHGPSWGYRYRARLSVRFVIKKQKVLVGFHERKSGYVADMESCAVLPGHVSAMLIPLREMIGKLDARDACPQIELACGDDVTALVLRHLEPLTERDQNTLQEFAHQYPVQWWLQPGGLDSIHLMDSSQSLSLSYSLPEFDIQMPFMPTDFTQVNPWINRVLVAQALQLLAVQKQDRVIDWFCGLGNFTLPLATQAKSVVGVEGSAQLIQRSKENFIFNQTKRQTLGSNALCDVQFKSKNLFEINSSELQELGFAHKWLIDPPREGAFELIKALVELIQNNDLSSDWKPPSRMVYVSCNPATLARDAELLVNQGGYVCSQAGIVNMFPHTAHVESIAVFEKGD